jgi:pSer/pThr/pTyr-binding forkhead associated (FHA) protein
MLPALIGVAVGLLIRFLILYIRKRNQAARANTPPGQPLPSPQPWKPQKAVGPAASDDQARTERPGGTPILRGVAGMYAGSSLELSREPLTLGRDARAANLVLPPDAGAVSQRHCIISWDGQRFLIEDCWSTNGTFLISGEKLTPGNPRPLVAGDQFFVGDQQNVFEVNFE